MNNKINEIIVEHNDELSSELILQYLQERKLIQIKNNSCISNRLSPIKSGKPGVIINSSGSINMPKHCYHSIANLNQSANYCGKWLMEQDFDISNIIIFNVFSNRYLLSFIIFGEILIYSQSQILLLHKGMNPLI